jgi:hypothetical protein
METEAGLKAKARMGSIVLWVAIVGCVTLPFGVLLLAYSFLVSLVMVVGDARDGRPVSRSAVAAMILCVAWPAFCFGLLPRLIVGS